MMSKRARYIRLLGHWCRLPLIGGTGWFEPPFERPKHLDTRIAYVNGWSRFVERFGLGIGHSAIGIAGTDVHFLSVTRDEGTVMHPIESPFGAFIVAKFATRADWKLTAFAEDMTPLYEKHFLEEHGSEKGWFLYPQREADPFNRHIDLRDAQRREP